MARLPPRVLLSFFLLVSLLVLGTAPAAQNPLRETRVSTPTVVRTEYDMREVASAPSLSADEVRGRQLFVQRCALCHDPLGQPSYPNTPGPWVDAETVTSLGEESVRDQIMLGSARMPGWQFTLEPAQVNQVIAYLKTVTPDQRP